MQAAQAALEAATVEVQRLSTALQEVRGHAEQRRADVAAQSSQGAVVRALMAAKSAGSLPGIYGRLGEPPAFLSAAKDDWAGYGAMWKISSSSQPEQHSRNVSTAQGWPMPMLQQSLCVAARPTAPPVAVTVAAGAASRQGSNCTGASSLHPKTRGHVASMQIWRPHSSWCPEAFHTSQCDPAGDLGAIDAKFDVAASTSCGGLDYIVVEDTATAQKCVDMLRR